VGPDEVTRELGLRPCPTEGDAVEEALRRRLGLAEPTGCRGGDGWWVREHADARPPVYVLAAPPTRPGMRANTADTFVGWAELLQEVRSAIRSMQSLYAAVA
jgi:hypothetical protein